ncbi:MAG: hypothetical protein HY885_07250 [Deltaproteobacteria bacterium]|nr:hypothetical protein [Deltaproteobacteria bacterium]
MENTNYKNILDRTFMLLEQAIAEKKAEQGAPEYNREFYDTEKKLLKKAGNQQAPKG